MKSIDMYGTVITTILGRVEEAVRGGFRLIAAELGSYVVL